MQIVLISGLSGSGKSIALNVLEDAGYYVVDNLPAVLLPQLAAHLHGAGWRRVAVAVDMRSGASIAEFFACPISWTSPANGSRPAAFAAL